MSSVKTTTAPDTRNLGWLQNNKGAKLLQKMGWKEGQAVGRRLAAVKDDNSDVESSDEGVSNEDDAQQQPLNSSSTEGLRIVRRQDGLGIGASHILHTTDNSHTKDFAQILQQLNQQQTTADEESGDNKLLLKKKKKSKSKTSMLRLPTNKTTHHKIRQAKFQTKSSDDLKCIFAGAMDFPVISAATGVVAEGSNKTKKKKKSSKTDRTKVKKTKTSKRSSSTD
jgi:hypothetical protein